MAKRVVVRVSSESAQFIRAFAAKKGLDLGEAADRLIKTVRGRLGALETYNKKAAAR